MEKNITKVKILGQEYKISCPPEESDQVKDAAKFFDKRLKEIRQNTKLDESKACLLYTSPSPRDRSVSRMPSSA